MVLCGDIPGFEGGASGGIIVMWDKWMVNLIEECIGDYSVACFFKKRGR